MRAVHEHLDEIVEANRQDGDKVKGAAVIDAYPGLGKSTIAQVFARNFHHRQVSLYGPVTRDGHDRVPVVHVCLTSSTSKKSFIPAAATAGMSPTISSTWPTPSRSPSC